MENQTAGTVTILGINGRIGTEAARAFAAAGWNVTGMSRANRHHIPGVRFIAGDAANASDIARAAKGSGTIVNALNLPYDKWDKGRAEAQAATVLEALAGSGKTLIFPGNIYNFAASQLTLKPDTPQHPEKPKGEIRVRVEQMLEQAARDTDLQVIIVRSADFYAPFATGSNFDLAMMARVRSNVLQYPGPLDIPHSWAYLPDLARAYVRLAEIGKELGRFERFHFEGHFATGHEMIAAIQAVLPKKAKVTQVPWTLLRLIGLFVPVVREVITMNYLWWAPHRLVDERLRGILGAAFDTPFNQAVAETARSYLPDAAPRNAAQPPSPASRSSAA